MMICPPQAVVTVDIIDLKAEITFLRFQKMKSEHW